MHRTFTLVLLSIIAASCAKAHDQQIEEERAPYFVVQSYFFADNSEFGELPHYRSGRTLLGSQTRAAAVLPVYKNVKIRFGGFFDTRSGSESDFNKVRPVVSLIYDTPANQLVMGTLVSQPTITATGPMRSGLHGLLPPLQDEDFAIERGYENGLQWIHSSSRLEGETWINWQRLNLPEHRERFDVGFVGLVRVAGPVSLGVQAHMVHEGGQLFRISQPVADMFAGGAGFLLQAEDPRLFVSSGPRVLDEIASEVYVIASSYFPDRNTLDGKLNGHGIFIRNTFRLGGWCAHTTFWWAEDFIKEEGDPNYGFLLLDGTYDDRVGTGDMHNYSEYGLYRQFLFDHVQLEGGFRLHFVDGDIGYSTEINAVVNLDYILGRKQ